MESSHKCLHCGTEVQGRADKKYCSDKCRASYHNQNKKPHELAVKYLNSQLRKNRTILKTLCPLGEATVRKEVLEHMGFSFRHFTSLYEASGNRYYLCYDYGYMAIMDYAEDDQREVPKVFIVQQQEYMRHFDPWHQL